MGSFKFKCDKDWCTAQVWVSEKSSSYFAV